MPWRKLRCKQKFSVNEYSQLILLMGTSLADRALSRMLDCDFSYDPPICPSCGGQHKSSSAGMQTELSCLLESCFSLW